jgi:iron(III) transport system permease protein
MRAADRIVAAAALLAVTAIVFSPLVAALVATDLPGAGMAESFRGLAGPYAESAGSAFVSAIVSLLIGVPFALFVERSLPRIKTVLWSLGLLVFIVPPYIVAEGWIVLLGPAGKISKPIAIFFGLGPHSGDALDLNRFVVPGLVYTWPAMGVVMGGCLFPIVALAIASALRRTDYRIFESARMAQGRLGVGRAAALMLIPPALGAALLVFAVTLTEFAVPQLLRVRTIGEAVYERIQEGELATAATLSLPLMPLVVAAGALGAYVLVRVRVASLASLEGEVPRYATRPAGRAASFWAAVVTFLAVVPGLLLPLTSLIWLALTARLAPVPGGGTHRLLRSSGFLNSLAGAWDLAHSDAVRTVLLAALGATLAVALATFLIRSVSRSGWSPVLGILGAGLAVPAPLVGLGLIRLWDNPWSSSLYQSCLIVLFAWFARFLPLAVFLAHGALARVPRELESAAALAGRGTLERFCAVVFPIALPGLVAAWLATYVLSATEFSATVLIAPPGAPLLAPSVVNLMRRGQDPEIAACQFLLLAVIALPVVLIAVGAGLRAKGRRAEN